MQQRRVVHMQWREMSPRWRSAPAWWSAALALALVGMHAFDPPQAHADKPIGATATAESQALFDEGMGLAAAGKYGEACPKLEASMKIEPEIGTRFYLGDCYEHIGKLASAYALFRDVEESAKKKDQKEAAHARAKTLEPRLVRVVVDVPDNVRKIPGLVVQRGDVTLSIGQLGTAVPIDPGTVAISATAPGKKRWEMSLAATKEGATLTVQAPMLEDATSGSTSPPLTVSNTATPWSAQRIAGVTVAGFGLVATGIGSALGAVAIGKKNASDKDGHCDASVVCDDAGLALRGEGRAAGDASTGLFIAGGTLLAGGVVLFLTAPRSQDKKPEGPSVTAYVGAGALGVRGKW
jgi:hypothetical protein